MLSSEGDKEIKGYSINKSYKFTCKFRERS